MGIDGECVEVQVLLEVVRIDGKYAFSKPHLRVAATSNVKESLTTKEKLHFSSKMVVFEKISRAASHRSLCMHRCISPPSEGSSFEYSLAVRLNYTILKQEGEHIASMMWIKPAAETLLSALNGTHLQ